jgi:hypothetical protein
MKTLSKGATRIMDKLTQGLEVGSGRKIDNAKGTFMAVSVNRLGDRFFSVTHYFKQNGDLVPDPDMVFWQGVGERPWVPVSYQDQRTYSEAVTFRDDQPVGMKPALQADLTNFANTWMGNIRDQQGLGRKRRAA